MDNPLGPLRTSVGHLHDLCRDLGDGDLERQSYDTEWSIAQVLSHLGSGAVILRRRLQDIQAGSATPDEFAPSVWDDWNAKEPRAQADDALVADEAVLEALEDVSEAEQAELVFAMGPLSLGFNEFAGLRLNEHVFHTWDIEVVFDDAARLPQDATPLVVANLALIARFSGRPDGGERTVAIRTSNPERDVSLHISADGVELTPGEGGQPPDLELPAEAFCRLVYGRLDPDHTPPFAGDADLLDALRAVFPGP
jgi:uncharacterized protein (TIGR03083 family)